MPVSKVAHLTSAHGALDIRIFHKECRTLARAGHDVTIVGRHSSDSVVDHVRIKAIPNEDRRFVRMTLNVWRVCREALRLDADVYHFHDPELIPVGLLLRALGKAVVYDVHEDVPKDILSKYYLPFWTRRAVSWAARTVQGVSSPYFSAIVAVTPSIAEQFESRNRQTVIIRNFPLVQELIPTGECPAWETRTASVAYIGAVTAQRGIRELVEAMALLPESLRATLEIAGNEVPAHADPARLYQHSGWQRVNHHGILSRGEVWRLMGQVRAGLVLFHPKPNHMEAMPNKLFEYMAAGLPVIGSDFPLWRRLIGKLSCGILVDPLNTQAIANAVEYLLTHPREAEEMGRRGRDAVVQQFNWGTQEPELLGLYARLMEQQCPA